MNPSSKRRQGTAKHDGTVREAFSHKPFALLSGYFVCGFQLVFIV